MGEKVVNSGSAIGEAIGAAMEESLKRLLTAEAKKRGYLYLDHGVNKNKNGSIQKRLLMYDDFGNDYSIDGVITDVSYTPIIIFESKYIRYKKHNRDKGSWICNSHTAVRRHYSSIRSSIAVLAGSWSRTSLDMIKSYGTKVFLIDFDFIADLLEEYGIDFRWEEKEKEKADTAWDLYCKLTSEQKSEIGDVMVKKIEKELLQEIQIILADKKDEDIEKINLEIVSSIGRRGHYTFSDFDAIIEFASKGTSFEHMIAYKNYTLKDIPEINEADEK